MRDADEVVREAAHAARRSLQRTLARDVRRLEREIVGLVGDHGPDTIASAVMTRAIALADEHRAVADALTAFFVEFVARTGGPELVDEAAAFLAEREP